MVKNESRVSGRGKARVGWLYFLAGVVILMGIITAEAYYPSEYNYTSRNSMISDLGATEPPDSLIVQPSATIFNLSMVAAGLMVVGASWQLYKEGLKQGIIAGIFGIGVLGVGIFPGNVNPWHPIFAMTAFLFGGLSAVVTAILIKGILRYLWAILGLIALVSLFFHQMFIPYLGEGGIEQWIAYPVVLWLVSLGGYLNGGRELTS